jgi:hypothetical protein
MEYIMIKKLLFDAELIVDLNVNTEDDRNNSLGCGRSKTLALNEWMACSPALNRGWGFNLVCS